MEHEADHGEDDHGFGHLWQALVILGQAPPTTELAECSFDGPTARQHDKALDAWDTADDDQREAEQEAGEQHSHAVMDAVGEHGLEPAPERLDVPKQDARAVYVLDKSNMHKHAEHP